MGFVPDNRLTRPGRDFVRMQVSCGVAAIRRAPEPDAEMLTHALGGDAVRVFSETGEFAEIQMESDGYVGWALLEALSAPVLPASHRVTALRTYVFSAPSIKSAPHFLLSRNARIVVEREEGRFLKIARSGWVVREHVADEGEGYADDPAGIAETYLHTPYLWGGKESLGLDCSGLVQMAFAACGVTLPRDTDMQSALAGEAVEDWRAPGALRRGDLVFWKGHVGLMLDADMFIHANAHHMRVAIEPVAQAIDRIGALYGQPTGARRVDVSRLRGQTPDWLANVLG